MPTTLEDLDLPRIDAFALDHAAAQAAVAQARAGHWLARTSFGYVVTTHDDVTTILRDQRFGSAIAALPGMAAMAEPFKARRRRSILALEGAEHQRLRHLATPAFTPKAADRLRPFMREVVGGLVDAIAPTGRCELVEDVCEPYPIHVICELLGAPQQDWRLFSAWATDIFRMFNGHLGDDYPVIEAAMGSLDAYVRDLVEQRRQQPGDDLLTRLIAAEEQGDRLSTDELVAMAEAVLMAGTDTTRNQLACAVALFADHPDQWALLASAPALATQAVEEAMRHLGAVRSTARIALEDVDYRDVTFPAGTLIVTSLSAANHDPELWEAPGRFDITRAASARPQMTFGSGIHHCLGASLARAELQEALPLLARRLPDLQLDGPIEWKPPTTGIWGPQRLPLRFTPGQ